MRLNPYDVVIEVFRTRNKGGNNTSRVITIEGKMPDGGTDFGINAEWSAPFAELSGGTIGQLLALGGISLNFQQASLQVWGGSSPIDLTIPIEFQAIENARTEVIQKVRQLMELAAPDVDGSGRFIPPGPTIADLGALIARGLEQFGVSEETQQKVKNSTSGGEKITVHLGNFFRLDSVVITSVRPQWSSVFDPEGLPMKAVCSVSMKSFLTPSRANIRDYFFRRTDTASGQQ